MFVAVSGASLTLLALTWLVATLGLGAGVEAVERAIYRQSDVEPIGFEFWCIVAGGGGAVGGLVAFSTVADANMFLGPLQHAVVAVFSLLNVTLVATTRWVLNNY